MGRVRTAARLHLLTVKHIQNAGEGDHSDGGGLMLRIRGASSSWVFRFTSPTGRRRKMGLGVAHRGSASQAGAPRAVEILRQLRAMRLHRDWVFPSPMLPNKPLSNMAMLTALGRLGMRDRTTVHRLCRATFSTWANETGAARPDVIEACLAHEEPGARRLQPCSIRGGTQGVARRVGGVPGRAAGAGHPARTRCLITGF